MFILCLKFPTRPDPNPGVSNPGVLEILGIRLWNFRGKNPGFRELGPQKSRPKAYSTLSPRKLKKVWPQWHLRR